MLSNISTGFCIPDNSGLKQQDGRTSTGTQGIEIDGGIWLERDQCSHVLLLAQAAMSAGVVAATLLQFIGALQVREYAKRLAAKEAWEGDISRDHDDDDLDAEEKEYAYRDEYADCERGRGRSEVQASKGRI